LKRFHENESAFFIILLDIPQKDVNIIGQQVKSLFTKRRRKNILMAKMMKKIAKTMGFSKKSKTGLNNSFIDFVESFVNSVDPKNFNI